MTTNGGVDGNPGRGLGFSPVAYPILVSGHPSETSFKATPGCESVVVVKILQKFSREIRTGCSRVSVTARNISLSILIPTRALALQNRELRNVLFAIWRHVVHFNIDRLARLVCRDPSKSWYISDTYRIFQRDGLFLWWQFQKCRWNRKT